MHPAEHALESERRLFPATHELTDPTTPGKSLLTRATHPATTELSLTPISGEADWARYERFRIEVEAGFGVGPELARAMVTTLRERTVHLGLTMLFARTTGDVVGAVGFFRLTDPAWARLQEVDVFPAWRGRGFGNALLSAVSAHLAGIGVGTSVVGADEDDWPLSWYRRRGFTVVTRVPLSR
ncbi:GNAT family N-acetyltransferase [Kineosporia sp. J2-2]|uniref:GNAT family N-acetyltransferase n=1 Tax=Kineosporia corallincola TaxID=2835133 RepID=A0ABS5TED1_9ACTN|nr:GNAT family N-acetyltransferase [Kineosporia corallincola]MBT0769427.1 GNAT family N-acetyltransferase [Kineosporia corallincola]